MVLQWISVFTAPARAMKEPFVPAVIVEVPKEKTAEETVRRVAVAIAAAIAAADAIAAVTAVAVAAAGTVAAW